MFAVLRPGVFLANIKYTKELKEGKVSPFFTNDVTSRPIFYIRDIFPETIPSRVKNKR